MPRKSNKTAHVLGLITNKKEDSITEQNIEKIIPPPEGYQKKSEANVQVTSSDDSNEISDVIKKRLIKEVEKSGEILPPELEQEPEPTPEPMPAPKQKPEPAPEQKSEPVPEQKSEPAPEPTPEPEPAAEDSAPAEGIKAEDEKAPVQEPDKMDVLLNSLGMVKGYDAFERYNDSEYCYINVIESVVKERILEFMEKFDMCTCDRCIMDTIALCLSNMNPKYVVAKRGDCFPLLNYYSSRFSADIVSALTKACLKVCERPHHDIHSEL